MKTLSNPSLLGITVLKKSVFYQIISTPTVMYSWYSCWCSVSLYREAFYVIWWANLGAHYSFDDTRECMHKLGELLSSQQASVTLSCEKPNDFWQNSKKGSVLTLFRGGKLILYSANNFIWGSCRSHQTRLQQAMKTLKSSLLTLLCLTRIMSTFGPNNFSDQGRSWVVIDFCFETCERLVYMSSTKEARGFYL